MRIWKWFYPGMHVKRWIVLCFIGICGIVAGTVVCVQQIAGKVIPLLGIMIVLSGIGVLIGGIERFVKSLVAIFRPLYREQELADIVYKKRQLSRGPRIVVIGGGTGLAVLLQGLKEYTSNITAIVTVTDDGGSSGRLREQFNILPPGDIRSCLVALADAGPLMQDLFQFRFADGTELAGHNFGNLFITAMTKLTGGFDKAIKESSRVLAISGSVVPSTLHPVTLIAEHVDGGKTYGETNISQSQRRIRRVRLRPENSRPTADALDALSNAEMIVLGPGSLYTSVIPNLVINGMIEAINQLSVPKIYICNVMTQAGETDHYSAYDHVRALLEHTSARFVDYCLINTGGIPPAFLEQYRRENSDPVVADIERIDGLNVKSITGDFISTDNYVRHNGEKIAKKIIAVFEEHKNMKNGVYV